MANARQFMAARTSAWARSGGSTIPDGLCVRITGIKAGQSVTFSPTIATIPSGDPFTIDFGDGTVLKDITTNPKTPHVYEQDGDYDIVVTGNLGKMTSSYPIIKEINSKYLYDGFSATVDVFARNIPDASYGSASLFASDSGLLRSVEVPGGGCTGCFGGYSYLKDSIKIDYGSGFSGRTSSSSNLSSFGNGGHDIHFHNDIDDYAFFKCRVGNTPDTYVPLNGPCHCTFEPTCKRIGSNSFAYSRNLFDEVVIPEGFISIGSYAFQKCSGVRRLILPSALTNISVGNRYTFEFASDDESNPLDVYFSRVPANGARFGKYVNFFFRNDFDFSDSSAVGRNDTASNCHKSRLYYEEGIESIEPKALLEPVSIDIPSTVKSVGVLDGWAYNLSDDNRCDLVMRMATVPTGTVWSNSDRYQVNLYVHAECLDRFRSAYPGFASYNAIEGSQYETKPVFFRS